MAREKNNKAINIISIHYTHNASVALLRDGRILCSLNEERFNRIKNSTGFPVQSLKYLRNNYGSDITYYIFNLRLPSSYKYYKAGKFVAREYNPYYIDIDNKASWRYKLSPKIWQKARLYKLEKLNRQEENDARSKGEMKEYFSSLLGVPEDKLIFIDHHLAHALSVNFFNYKQDRCLYFTLDGEGDNLCASVNIFDQGRLETISRVSRAYSPGYLYREVTAYLGLRPDEHEYKVMGLAPYAKDSYLKQILPIFEKILFLNELDEFRSVMPLYLCKYYLRENLVYHRFDNIAGAIQLFTEKIVLEWISRWIKKTGIKNIGLAGGVFMNVKMNQRIAEMDEVDCLAVVPSSGDETTVLGGCYYGYHKFCADNNRPFTIERIDNLYLGVDYSDNELKNFLDKGGYFSKYKISKPVKTEKALAELLARNEIVARFSGRMEFGARALGNRSILANPSRAGNVNILNEFIKSRDFWMPFAPTILVEEGKKYIINEKNIASPFMAICFNTTLAGKRDLIAAIHPKDKTCRPQILKPTENPSYYELIREFKKLTGIGAVLNTSFNLHGEPNVMSPVDAMHTFENSGLIHLALGPYLISKQ